MREQYSPAGSGRSHRHRQQVLHPPCPGGDQLSSKGQHWVQCTENREGPWRTEGTHRTEISNHESLRTGMVTSKQGSMIDRQWLTFISDKMVSVHLSTSQTLMRYISEWDPRKAKWPWCVVFNRWFLQLLIEDNKEFIKLNFASQRGSAHQGRVSGRKHLTASFSGNTQVGVSHTYLIPLNNWRWHVQVGNSDLACRWCGPRGCRNPSNSASCCQDWQG